MHYGPYGREPLHGLTSERYIPPREFSAAQQRHVQVWAVSFFNAAGMIPSYAFASVTQAVY